MVWAPPDQTATVVLEWTTMEWSSADRNPHLFTQSEAVFTHRRRPFAVVYAEGYGLEKLYFSFILTGQVAPRHTLTQTHKYTHVCSHLIGAV